MPFIFHLPSRLGLYNTRTKSLQTDKTAPPQKKHVSDGEAQVMELWEICSTPSLLLSPFGWGCRIHLLLLYRGVRPPSNECPGYDTNQSDGEVPVILEFWGIRSTLSLQSLPGPLWPEVVVPDKGPIYELNRTKPWFEFTVFGS